MPPRPTDFYSREACLAFRPLELRFPNVAFPTSLSQRRFPNVAFHYMLIMPELKRRDTVDLIVAVFNRYAISPSNQINFLRRFQGLAMIPIL
jgi:hypothetical protein